MDVITFLTIIIVGGAYYMGLVFILTKMKNDIIAEIKKKQRR